MPLGLQEIEAPRISRQSAHEDAAFALQEISEVLISVRGLVEPRAIVWPKGLSQ
jgi:hypothetical protein